MKIVGIVFGVIVAAVLVLLGVASQQPEDYRAERSVVTTASPSTVYAVLADLRRFPEWSPWDKIDPNVKRTFAGPASGPGSSFAWDGNDEVGAGRMTITDVKPDAEVAVDLEFLRPFPSHAKVLWQVSPADAGSKIVWVMNGKNATLLLKTFHLLMDFEKMVGPDFETGLARFKELVERP